MTTSRLKFELIDGTEPSGFDPAQWPLDVPPSKPPAQANSARRPGGERGADKVTNDLASLGQQITTSNWPETSGSARAAAGAGSLADPRLLQDLAEGFEFLHRQLEDSDTELERNREQSRAFERDARRWEQEAVQLRDEGARLRQEGEETRRTLEALRREFDESRSGRERQQDSVARIVEEMAEMRAARVHLEELAAEQQKALVLSLELLKRFNGESKPAAAVRVTGTAAAQLAEKDRVIDDLRRFVEEAGEEGARLDMELVAVRSELLASVNDRDAARAQITSLRHELEGVSAEAESTRSELASAQAELTAYHMEHDSTRNELEATRAELARAQEEAGRSAAFLARADQGPDPSPELTQKIKELEQHRVMLSDKLRDSESEIALQSAEVESRGAIITALENALEEQNTSLRKLEERFLAYAEQVQSLQLQRLEMPANSVRGIAEKFVKAFSPSAGRRGKRSGTVMNGEGR